jgi:hypothetical protein
MHIIAFGEVMLEELDRLMFFHNDHHTKKKKIQNVEYFPRTDTDKKMQLFIKINCEHTKYI